MRGRRARVTLRNRKVASEEFRTACCSPIYNLPVFAYKNCSPRMRSSRSQMQPFARHWPTGRPSVTVVLVVVSLAAAIAQLSYWLFDRGDAETQEKLFAWLGLTAQSMR